jgi:hypothetical protein
MVSPRFKDPLKKNFQVINSKLESSHCPILGINTLKARDPNDDSEWRGPGSYDLTSDTLGKKSEVAKLKSQKRALLNKNNLTKQI